MSDKLQYHLRIPPAEVMSRIASSIDTERLSVFSSSGFAGRGQFHGKLTGDKFHIRRRHPYGNPYGRYWHGDVSEEGTGSRVTVDYHMSGPARAFVVLCLATLMYFAVGTLVESLRLVQRGDVVTSVMLALAPLAMMVLFAGLLRFSWWLSRSDRRETRALLDRLFEDAQS